MPQITNLRLLFSPLKPSILRPKPPISLFSALASSSPKRHRIIVKPLSPGTYRHKSSTPFRETINKKSRNRDGDAATMEKGKGSFGFNRKRAEGDGNDKPRKILKVKERKLNPTNTIAYVQILGTGMDTQDTSPSVLLFFDKQRFIFNAGEGLQRFCTEHKIKLSKIDYIFLSRVCSETAGGLPGLLLTLAGMGDEGMAVNVWGPSDLQYLVRAIRSFIPGAAMVHTNEFGSKIQDSCKCSDPVEIIKNEVVKISAILLQPRSFESSASKPGDTSVVYLCELPEIMGKFDPSKARALGLRPGPKYSALQSGESVKSDSKDIVVHPSDVMGPSLPGPVVLLVDCPTESHAQELLAVQSLNNYYSDFSASSPENAKAVNCIIHLSPASVVSSPSYQMWMKKFDSSQHIMAGHEIKNVEIPILKSSARVAARLNYLCPKFFPSPGFWSLKHLNIPKDTDVSSKHLKFCDFRNSLQFHSPVTASAENLLKFTLRPHANLGLDKSNIPSSTSSSETIAELVAEDPEIEDAAQHVCDLWDNLGGQKMDVTSSNNRSIIEEPWLKENHLPSCLENIRRDDMEIVLLGTGSSQPSKYRNVSAIYIDLFSKGSLILDCGEGTLGQLRRRYGIEGANDAVRKLKCVWISHIHADHHTGLARILALRRELLMDTAHEPVLVVGPRQLKRFLDAYQSLEDLDMQFIDCRSTTNDSWNEFESKSELEETRSPAGNTKLEDQDKNTSNTGSTLFARGSRMQSYWSRPGSPVDNHMAFPLLKRLKRVLSEAGLEALVSFPVVHCPQAYGIVLKAAERIKGVGKVIPGWKIAYSGDTRPCPELVEASRGATVLIHEATFENDLVDEAIARNHSTTKEAIEVGDSAGAYRIILTHFSQRYPKIPVFDDTHMHKTCIAFDLMSVNIADLPVLPRVLPYLKMLFRNEMTPDELEEALTVSSAA